MQTPSSATAPSLANTVATKHIKVGDETIAYRSFGQETEIPLVLTHRFRGTIDDWDPAFLDALAAKRHVIVFDSAGIGASTGTPPDSIPGVAKFALDFIAALGLKQVDLLGWSMGGTIALSAALQSPGVVRRVVLAGSSPGGVPNPPPTPAKVWEVAGKPVNDAEDFLYLFFPETPEGRSAGFAHLARLGKRSEAPVPPVGLPSVKMQVAAIGALQTRDGMYPRLAEVQQPVLLANGVHDVMVPAYNSFAASERIPNAQLILYPASGHGFLFQLIEQFSRDVHNFLDAA